MEGIRNLVTFEGRSDAELTRAFHEAVSYYPDFCKKEPFVKPLTKTGCVL